MSLDPMRAADTPDTLAPDGSEIRLLAAHDAASVVEVLLPTGRVSIPVRHRTVQEIWYFLSGYGEVWRQAADGAAVTVAVGPGDALTIPLGYRFQFRNTSDEDLRFICMTTPPWPGDDEAIVEPETGLWPTGDRA